MSDKVFTLPDLGEGLTEGEIVRWVVAVGDRVEVDQVVAEIETAKAVVEVPTPFAGVVAALHGAEGEEVAVGAPLLTVAVDNGQRASAPEPEPGQVPEQAETADLVPEPEPAANATAPPDDGASGSVLVGYGTNGSGRRRRRRQGAAFPPATPAAAPAQSSELEDQAHIRAKSSNVAFQRGPVGAQGRPLAKPPVRKLAKDLGVPLSRVTPSGPDGVITRDDVRAAANADDPGKSEDRAHMRAFSSNSGAEAGVDVGAGEGERIPLKGVRKRIAERMTQSRREIPEATTWVDCDATALMAVRDDLNRAQSDVRVSPLALILRIAVAGLAEFKELNASIDGDEIVQHHAVHLGVAAQTGRGLVVPVIKGAHEMSALELAAELNRLAEGARDGSLTPAELTGSTFTVSNYGSFGVDGGNPVINYPEAAILGVGRISDRPWVHKGKVRVRKVMQLSIAFDHRIADGGEAAGFLRFMADRVEHPSLLLATL